MPAVISLFEGEKEIDRVREMQKFVEAMNTKYVDERAMRIPEIPDVMTEDFIVDNYGHVTRRQNKLVLGMSYDTVSPVAINSAAFLANACFTSTLSSLRFSRENS